MRVGRGPRTLERRALASQEAVWLPVECMEMHRARKLGGHSCRDWLSVAPWSTVAGLCTAG